MLIAHSTVDLFTFTLLFTDNVSLFPPTLFFIN